MRSGRTVPHASEQRSPKRRAAERVLRRQSRTLGSSLNLRGDGARAGDVVVAMGTAGAMDRLEALFSPEGAEAERQRAE